jgi:cytochrome c peroxidase
MRALVITGLALAGLIGVIGVVAIAASEPPAPPLGLPPVPIPEDNPQTPEKIALGDKLFNDKRFSSTGEVSCATCHDPKKGLTDSPLKVSEGITKGERRLLHAPVLGWPVAEPRGPGPSPPRQPRGDGSRRPPANSGHRPH